MIEENVQEQEEFPESKPAEKERFTDRVLTRKLTLKDVYKRQAEDRAARIVRLNFSLSVSNFVSLGGSPVAARKAFSLSSAACPFRFAQYSRSVMRFLLPCKRSI